MKRRDFIMLVGGAAAWPLAARAQQPAMPVVGFLDPGLPEANAAKVSAFRKGLADAGYVEGKNVTIEFRWAENRFERLSAMASDLVARQVAVIVAVGAPTSALAAKSATSTIPIVIAGGSDPIKLGLAVSLNHPGGNVTGMTFIVDELAGKRLDLLRELVPSATRVGYLAGDQRNENAKWQASIMLAAAAALERHIILLECRSDRAFEPAFATLLQSGAGALIVAPFVFSYNKRDKIVELAARQKLPTIYPFSEYAYEGGLMSYGVGPDRLRQVALQYVARILKGAKPADLPIQRPTKFELVINVKTAKTLGLTVPDKLLALADEVIE